MSAMADTITRPAADAPHAPRFSALRDLLLALSLTVLAALAMQASGAPVPNVPGGAPVVQEWRGNSGSLPVAPASAPQSSVKSASTG